MSLQLTPQQIAWRIAQDLPRGAKVALGAGMPLLVPNHVADERGIAFTSEACANPDLRDEHHAGCCVLGAREVAQNGDLVAAEDDTERDATSGALAYAATASRVLVMSSYFAPNGRPTLVPQCTVLPDATGCVTTLYTDIAILDLRDGKAWLREIIEGITLQVLQAETEVQLYVAPPWHKKQIKRIRSGYY